MVLSDGLVILVWDPQMALILRTPTLLLRSLYQLTWQSPRAWVYPIDRFEAASLVSTPLLDGWGITNDGAHLILGNSSAVLSWVEPGSMRMLRTLRVQDAGRDVPFLNELEWINGSLWANVWSRECLANISPRTGHVRAWASLKVLAVGRQRDAGCAGRGMAT